MVFISSLLFWFVQITSKNMPIQAHRLSRAPFLSDLIPILICNNNKHEFSPKPLIFCTFSTDPSLQSYPISTCNTEAKRDRNFSRNNLQFSTTTGVQTARGEDKTATQRNQQYSNCRFLHRKKRIRTVFTPTTASYQFVKKKEKKRNRAWNFPFPTPVSDLNRGIFSPSFCCFYETSWLDLGVLAVCFKDLSTDLWRGEGEGAFDVKKFQKKNYKKGTPTRRRYGRPPRRRYSGLLLLAVGHLAPIGEEEEILERGESIGSEEREIHVKNGRKGFTTYIYIPPEPVRFSWIQTGLEPNQFCSPFI